MVIEGLLIYLFFQVLLVFLSVRCGLEMVFLNVMVVKYDFGLMGIFYCQKEENGFVQLYFVLICVFFDFEGILLEVVYVVRKFVEEGFSVIKFKVS